MILGIYYLSQEPISDKPAGYFTNSDQIEFALSSGQINVHSTIISRFETVDDQGNKKMEKYTSTAGRFLLANLLPCLLYTSPSPRDRQKSRMPSSA